VVHEDEEDVGWPDEERDLLISWAEVCSFESCRGHQVPMQVRGGFVSA
jgi:hypothetical protein